MPRLYINKFRTNRYIKEIFVKMKINLFQFSFYSVRVVLKSP